MAVIAQALFENDIALQRSPSFDASSSESISQILRRIRTTSDNSLFVVTVGHGGVAVVQARAPLFRVLLLWDPLYADVGNPFLVSRMYPPDFSDRGSRPDLHWDAPPEPRTIEQLRGLLKSDEGPTLLGAAQALVDGGRVVFERPQPDAATLERLWMLLPDSARGELRLATYVHDNELGFDLLVSPKAEGPTFVGCLTDVQAGDYPQGRYELNLQIAVESGDEAEVSRLLSRRSGRQALRLMVTVLIVALAIGLASRFILNFPAR